MRLAILVLTIFLSGCSMFTKLVPAGKPAWPEATPELMEKCKDLQQITGDVVTMTQLMKSVVDNYTLYYQCSNKVEGWQQWYEEKKKTYESIK